jgi:uncharacterized protein YwqG
MEKRQIELSTALEAMEPFMRPGVLLERIWPPGDTPNSWQSQIGGHPNLPPDWEWPRIQFEDGRSTSLDFLAQVRLGDLPDIEERELLPRNGMLYFFALSQSPVPLSEHGPQAWRVLYCAGDTSGFPRRPPPPDAGWNLEAPDTTATPAAEYRDPETSRGELFPRCPIRAVKMWTWKWPSFEWADDPRAAPFNAVSESGRPFRDIEPFWNKVKKHWQGSAPPQTSFKYNDADLPSHVEDALLLLNSARNEWREGLLRFDDIVQAKASRKHEAGAIDGVEVAHADWLDRVKAAVRRLKARGRTTALSDAERAEVRTLVDEDSALRETLTGYGLTAYLHTTTFTSLASLLIDHPEAAAARADEIAAAHPGHAAKDPIEIHQMLGHGHAVQDDLAEGSVVLLQLGSDGLGPRFCWWDAGNITFWIANDDLAALRFDRAHAEIEGH